MKRAGWGGGDDPNAGWNPGAADMPTAPNLGWASQLDEVVNRHGDPTGTAARSQLGELPTASSLFNNWDAPQLSTLPNVFGGGGGGGGGANGVQPAEMPPSAEMISPISSAPPTSSTAGIQDPTSDWARQIQQQQQQQLQHKQQQQNGSGDWNAAMPILLPPPGDTFPTCVGVGGRSGTASVEPDRTASAPAHTTGATAIVQSQSQSQSTAAVTAAAVSAVARSVSSIAVTTVTPSNGSGPVRVFIPRPMVGRIIGKGGVVINQIRQESGADVRIVDHESDQGGRTLTIQGSTSAVARCEQILNSKLRGDDAQAVLFIPEDMVGRIIGKGGVNIKKLTQLSGADAHMGDPQEGGGVAAGWTTGTGTGGGKEDEYYEDECAVCLDSPMVEPERTYCDHTFCKRCIRAVLQTHNDCPICKDPVNPGDLKRVKNRELRVRRPRPDVPMVASGRGRMLTIRGTPAQVIKCQGMVEAKLRGEDRQKLTAPGEDYTATLFVPEDMVGRIIGRGGAMIKQLRLQTGADVRMGDRDNTSGGRTLTIRGAQAAVHYAEELVEGKLES